MLIEEIKQIKESKNDLRKFGLTVGMFFLLIAIILFLKGKDSYRYFGLLSAVLIICSVIFLNVLKPINKLWMTAAIIIGWLMTRVILTILFYLVLTPISLLAKILKKDFLDISFNGFNNSYWIKREKNETKVSDYEKQY